MMRKNFGVKSYFYPLPVLMIATYDEEGRADCMNAAWGGLYDANQVILCLSASHKTTKNIHLKKAFTVSFADAKHVAEADYLGLVSGNQVHDKLEKANLHVTKSEFVEDPLIDEFPLTLECRYIKDTEDGNIIGEIVNVSADESILGEDGKIDVNRLEAISFDPSHNTYVKVQGHIGNAFQDGNAFK